MLDLDGYSCEIRVIGTVHTNTTAPGVNFTFGVTSIAAAAAGAGLSGWTLGGSPIATAVVTAPGAASIVSTVGSTASGFSTDGPYALYVTNSGSTAASSFQGIHIEVQMRWIPT